MEITKSAMQLCEHCSLWMFAVEGAFHAGLSFFITHPPPKLILTHTLRCILDEASLKNKPKSAVLSDEQSIVPKCWFLPRKYSCNLVTIIMAILEGGLINGSKIGWHNRRDRTGRCSQ